jgi:hypothetical protein
MTHKHCNTIVVLQVTCSCSMLQPTKGHMYLWIQQCACHGRTASANAHASHMLNQLTTSNQPHFYDHTSNSRKPQLLSYIKHYRIDSSRRTISHPDDMMPLHFSGWSPTLTRGVWWKMMSCLFRVWISCCTWSDLQDNMKITAKWGGWQMQAYVLN